MYIAGWFNFRHIHLGNQINWTKISYTINGEARVITPVSIIVK